MRVRRANKALAPARDQNVRLFAQVITLFLTRLWPLRRYGLGTVAGQ